MYVSYELSLRGLIVDVILRRTSSGLACSVKVSVSCLSSAVILDFPLGLSPLPGLIITRNSGDFAFWLLIISDAITHFFLNLAPCYLS